MDQPDVKPGAVSIDRGTAWIEGLTDRDWGWPGRLLKAWCGEAANEAPGRRMLFWIVLAVLSQGLMLESILELIKALFERYPSLFVPGWCALLVVGATGGYAAFHKHWGQSEHRNAGPRPPVLRAAVSFIATLMAIGILLEAIFELIKASLEPTTAHQVWLLLATLVVVLLAALFFLSRALAPALAQLIADSQASRAVIRPFQDQPAGRKMLSTVLDVDFQEFASDQLRDDPFDVLIIPLSALDAGNELTVEFVERCGQTARQRLDWLCDDEVCPQLDRFNWRQVFRMIRPHIQFIGDTQVILPEVHLLTSSESEPQAGRWGQALSPGRRKLNARSFEPFTEWLKKVFDHRLTIVIRNREKGPSAAPNRLPDAFRFFDLQCEFENYNQVYQAIRAKREEIETRRPGVRVLIDLTGGPKPVAAAVTVLSLRRPEDRFGYVRSRENTKMGEVFAYRIDAHAPRMPDPKVVNPAGVG